MRVGVGMFMKGFVELLNLEELANEREILRGKYNPIY